MFQGFVVQTRLITSSLEDRAHFQNGRIAERWVVRGRSRDAEATRSDSRRIPLTVIHLTLQGRSRGGVTHG